MTDLRYKKSAELDKDDLNDIATMIEEIDRHAALVRRVPDEIIRDTNVEHIKIHSKDIQYRLKKLRWLIEDTPEADE